MKDLPSSSPLPVPIIERYFTPELISVIESIILSSNVDALSRVREALHASNMKYDRIHHVISDRVLVQAEDYLFKIALNESGRKNNLWEFNHSNEFQPHVIKCYECIFDGLITASENIKFMFDDFPIVETQALGILQELFPDGVSEEELKHWGGESQEEINKTLTHIANSYNLEIENESNQPNKPE